MPCLIVASGGIAPTGHKPKSRRRRSCTLTTKQRFASSAETYYFKFKEFDNFRDLMKVSKKPNYKKLTQSID